MSQENRSFVGIRGDDVIIGLQRRMLSKDDALNLAAWIVALTDKEEFEKVLKEVEAT